MIKQLKRTNIYANNWITVYEDEIEFPNGSHGTYGVVERRSGIAVLVLNSQNQVLLVKQFRYPTQQFEWNIPGGSVELQEELADAAAREVKEETGILIDRPVRINVFYPLSSLATESGTLFIARTQQKSIELKGNQIDEDIAEIKFFSIQEVLQMLDDGLILDSYTGNALQILARRFDEMTRLI